MKQFKYKLKLYFKLFFAWITRRLPRRDRQVDRVVREFIEDKEDSFAVRPAWMFGKEVDTILLVSGNDRGALRLSNGSGAPFCSVGKRLYRGSSDGEDDFAWEHFRPSICTMIKVASIIEFEGPDKLGYKAV